MVRQDSWLSPRRKHPDLLTPDFGLQGIGTFPSLRPRKKFNLLFTHLSCVGYQTHKYMKFIN